MYPQSEEFVFQPRIWKSLTIIQSKAILPVIFDYPKNRIFTYIGKDCKSFNLIICPIRRVSKRPRFESPATSTAELKRRLTWPQWPPIWGPTEGEEGKNEKEKEVFIFLINIVVFFMAIFLKAKAYSLKECITKVKGYSHFSEHFFDIKLSNSQHANLASHNIK